MSKLDLLSNKLSEASIDAIYVTDELNIRHIIGIEVQDAAMLITRNDAFLLTDFRYQEVASRSLGDEFTVSTVSDRFDFVKKHLTDAGISSLGFEGRAVTYNYYLGLKDAFTDFSLKDADLAFTELRMVKTQDEIDKIQRSQDITDKAFSELLKVIRTDMTEIEVAAELEYLMRKLGSDGPAFSTIAVSGDASSLPHGEPRGVKLKRGFLTLDFGSRFEGYCSDMTRTIVIGKADEDMKKLYNTVLSAQLAALEYLEAGRDAGEADAVARRIIDKDYQGAFGHSLGHGVGLLVHESPALTPRAKGRILVPGNIVTVEPGIYLASKYGCRIEDMVAICDNGIHNFTHSTKELIEIY